MFRIMQCAPEAHVYVTPIINLIVFKHVHRRRLCLLRRYCVTDRYGTGAWARLDSGREQVVLNNNVVIDPTVVEHSCCQASCSVGGSVATTTWIPMRRHTVILFVNKTVFSRSKGCLLFLPVNNAVFNYKWLTTQYMKEL